MYKEEGVKLVNDEYAQDLVTASNEILATKRCIEITNRYQQLIKVIKLSMRQAKEVMTTKTTLQRILWIKEQKVQSRD